jgi:hypothetical protein
MTELAQPVMTENRDRKQEAYRVASELFRQVPDWVTFFREVLGVEGAVRRLFPNPAELSTFEQCEEYRQIQQMVARLRANGDGQGDGKEPTKVITVRMPQSLHEALAAEAYERHTSMNKLCITKLLQVLDDEMMPASKQK